MRTKQNPGRRGPRRAPRTEIARLLDLARGMGMPADIRARWRAAAHRAAPAELPALVRGLRHDVAVGRWRREPQKITTWKPWSSSRKRNPAIDPVWLLLGGTAAVGALLWWQREAVGSMVSKAAHAIKDVFTQGDRLTYAIVDEARGLVPVKPAELAARAAVVIGRPLGPIGPWSALDVYSAARMVRSEGSRTGRPRLHVAFNDAQELGMSLTGMFTFSTKAERRGWYGPQLSRRYSTARDPFEGDVLLVEQTMRERLRGIDPTGGAVKFVDKSAMGGVQAGTGSYAALVERWGRDGLRPYNVPGYPTDLVVFRRT